MADEQQTLTDLSQLGTATGVTSGSLLEGVKYRRDGKMTTESVVMRASSGTVRWIKGEHQAK